jgi:hypothetical protein
MGEPRINKAGRRIWFSLSEDGGGTYRPVTRAGWSAFLLAGLWLLVCAVGCMAALALTLDGRWIGAMFVLGAIGLSAFAAMVIRHS